MKIAVLCFYILGISLFSPETKCDICGVYSYQINLAYSDHCENRYKTITLNTNNSYTKKVTTNIHPGEEIIKGKWLFNKNILELIPVDKSIDKEKYIFSSPDLVLVNECKQEERFVKLN